jgi:2-polyprenyl-3-methyl-5-hydroxy-6-metoxy-1,4-benzoquinol methylase
MHSISKERLKYDDIYGNKRRYDNTGELYGTVGNGLDVLESVLTEPVGTLLEVGCGYARVSLEVLRNGLADSILAIDISEALVTMLQTSPTFPSDRIEFECAPAHDIPADDKSYDMTFMFDVLEHIPEALLRPTLDEICRVTNGPFVCSVAWHEDIKFGHELHVTRKPEAWWMSLFAEYGEVEKLCDKPSGFYARVNWRA